MIVALSFVSYSIYTTSYTLVYISSCECKKVVSDILGETDFFADIKSACKITHFFTVMQVSTQKYLYFYETNKMSKNNEIQKISEHKIAFPAK